MNLTLSSDVILFRNDGDIYFGVYESDPFKIALVLLSITLSIFFLFPLFIAFIWYDYFGPHSERLILNRLISSMSVTALVYLIFVHFVDIARYIVGPFSEGLCFCELVMKNTLSLQMILFMDVMTITRYVFIFWQKNPAIFQNAFWNWLINMWVICFSLLSQLVYAYLPGHQPFTYFLCTGRDPATSTEISKKFNYIHNICQSGSVLINIVLTVQIRKYKMKHPLNNSIGNSKNNFFLFNIENKAVESFGLLVAIVAFIILGFFTAFKVNSLSSVQSNFYPNYLFINYFHLVNPIIICGSVSIIYYVKHKKMQKIIEKKLESIFPTLNDRLA